MYRTLVMAAATLAVVAKLSALNPNPQQKALADAQVSWAEGDYVGALSGYLALLNAPGGDAFHDAIAEHTGELYASTELTRDGRNARFSRDGRFIAYESGLEVSRRTTILRNDTALSPVAELPGVSASFSPDGTSVAYLKLTPSAELAAAARAVDEAPLAAANRNAAIQALGYQVYRSTGITIRDLTTGRERDIPAPALMKTGLVYGADGRSLYFLGGQEGDALRNDVYVVSEGTLPARVGGADGLKGVPTLAGNAIVYVVTAQNPFRPPQPPGGGGGVQGPQQRPPSFGIIDLATNRTTTIEGSAPTVSADGRTLAYVARDGNEHQVRLGPVLGPHTAIKKAADRLDAPALSPDGTRIAYQVMTRDDWEIHVAQADGTGEFRLTRDNQHDVLPRFIAPDRLIAVVGEARHRRSFLYDLATGSRTRLFHNNTVRTIAPEYQWSPSADGTRLLVGAERDGDTVSPERGVYLLRLDQEVSRDQLMQRLKQMLAGERALRASAERAFAPINELVRSVVDAVSVARIYAYEKALFDFDSKHISRPGNKLAAEYLFRTYESFGYQPEYQFFENRNALGGKTANVIATLKGSVHPELVYVVSSHFDSVAAGPGADDDSSGTAALLEAARVLASHPMPATIVFASFTGEESGLLGSREFVRHAVANKMQIVGALNNDMIGWTNDARLDNTIRYSNPGIRDVQHGAAMLFTKLITYDALYFKSTDAAAYYEAYGDIVGGIGSYPVLSNPHYHQPHDFLEFINHQLVAETSKTTVGTLMLLASSPSRVKGLTIDGRTAKGLTLSWAPSPERDVTSYLVRYTTPGAAVPTQSTVKAPRAALPVVPKGTVVEVKGVNAKGLEGWDWARIIVD
jgi:hypothetical protein